MKKLTALLSVALYIFSCNSVSNVVQAQTTVVSGTVTDSDSTLWAYGTIQVAFVPNPNNPNVSAYRINGAPLSPTVLYQGPLSLGAGGAFSVTVYDSTQITPVGSGWQYTICPNATSTYGCGIITVGSAGATQNLTSTVSATIKAPRFAPVSGTFGYVDVEAAFQLKPGSTYWNVTTLSQRYWNGAAWVTGAGTGGGSVNSFAAPSGSWPAWLVPSVTNATTNPSLAVAAGPIPNSALANDAVTIGDTNIALGGTTSSLDEVAITNSPEVESFLFDAPAGQPVIVQPGPASTTDFIVMNAAGNANNLQVDDTGNWRNASTQVVMPYQATQYWGPSNGGPLLTNVSPSGTGAPCLATGCTLVNSFATTKPIGDNNAEIATTAAVFAYVGSIATGVSSIIDSTNTGFVGNIKIPALTCTGTSPVVCSLAAGNVASVTVTLPALTIPANTCYGAGGTTTHSSISMPGLTATSAVWPVFTHDPSATTGFSGSGGAAFNVWPDAAGSLADYKVCNQTSTTLTTVSDTFRLAAQ